MPPAATVHARRVETISQLLPLQQAHTPGEVAGDRHEYQGTPEWLFRTPKPEGTHEQEANEQAS